MKVLVLKEPHRLEYEERVIPRLPEGNALLKTKAVSICGSDIHAYNGVQPLMVYPRVPGHEICAEVLEVRGGQNGPVAGDRVCVIPYLSCGECVTCRQGRTNCCTSLKVLGVHIDGGLAGYLNIPTENLIKIPDEVDNKTAALIEPLSVSAHSVRRGNIRPGDHVLVVGAGPIGLGAAEISKTFGADVILADTSEVRRGFAHVNFGYNVLNPLDASYEEQLKGLTNGNFPDKIIDSTGNQRSMAKDIDYLCYGGSIVFVGLQGSTLDISDPVFHLKEAAVYASRVALPEDFLYVIRCIQEGKIHPERFITDISDFDHAKINLEEWIKKGPGVFKGIIEVD